MRLDRDILETIFQANRASAQQERIKAKPAKESPKQVSARLYVRSMLEQRIRDIMTVNSLLVRNDYLSPMLRQTAIAKTVDYLNQKTVTVPVFTFEYVARQLSIDLGLSDDMMLMAEYITERLLEMGHTQLEGITCGDDNVYIVTR